MYDPSVGVWLSEDPIGFRGGTTNLREYVQNNPVNLTDPSGLAPWSKMPEISDQWEWHHILPQSIARDFGVNDDVHNSNNGYLIPAGRHTGSEGLHNQNWNDEWRRRLEDDRGKGILLDKSRIQFHSDEMLNDDRFTPHLKHGFKAPEGLSYDVWRDGNERLNFINKSPSLKQQLLDKQCGWVKAQIPEHQRRLKAIGPAMGVIAVLSTMLECGERGEATAAAYAGIMENLANGNLGAADHHAKKLGQSFNDAGLGLFHRAWMGVWEQARGDLENSADFKTLASQRDPKDYYWQVLISQKPSREFPGYLEDMEGTLHRRPPGESNFRPYRIENGQPVEWDHDSWMQHFGFPQNRRSGIGGWFTETFGF